ncbi:type II toxin-antitoxin system ParD family antitoxin [Oscillatoria sp. FACHB-1406]|uniref:ribbon-helix-helix domain-containing protein n=1 Tax=Oscillatoria sp. FACHB-1406 TaxID=2692846 RepID=UPI0016863D29|nr:type II toxin-antitoxin system ParD family antitoxin [Oscillatoria sp. FACHB-1406]MBD2579473.1 type II toxin-antitoxin system ParD family antitoxin [Oscillatoria sp. FACHB-1406]
MLNISLPEQIQAFIEEQTSVAGLNSVSEYIYQLILREKERIARQEQIESLLLEGLDSGEPIEANDEWWERKRIELLEQL